MKKTLLALSLLAAMTTGVAHAQSSVVLSGQLDIAVGADYYTMKWPFAEPYNDLRIKLPAKGSDNPSLYQSRELGLVRSPNGGSFIHFEGTEDFNNGLSAFFSLESAFDYNGKTVGDVFWSDEAIVGLKGDNFGQMTFGYQGSASSQLALNPFPNFNIEGKDLVGDAAGTTNNATLMYMTPVISGFQFAVSYDGQIFDVYNTDTKTWGPQDGAYNHFSAGLAYTGDLLSAAVTFDQLNTKAKDDQNLKPARAVTAGVGLTFSAVEAYYRFAYAARGYGNSLGEDLYNKASFNADDDAPVVDASGNQMFPIVFNGARAPQYNNENVHRYVHELGAIFNISDRWQLKVADQFGYSTQPANSWTEQRYNEQHQPVTVTVYPRIPLFVSGSSKEGSAAWKNSNGKGAAPKYVFNGRFSDTWPTTPTLKVYTNTVKMALVYRLFQRVELYTFGNYTYMHAKLDLNNKNVRADISKLHYVYAGVGFTVHF